MRCSPPFSLIPFFVRVLFLLYVKKLDRSFVFSLSLFPSKLSCFSLASIVVGMVSFALILRGGFFLCFLQLHSHEDDFGVLRECRPMFFMQPLLPQFPHLLEPPFYPLKLTCLCVLHLFNFPLTKRELVMPVFPWLPSFKPNLRLIRHKILPGSPFGFFFATVSFLLFIHAPTQQILRLDSVFRFPFFFCPPPPNCRLLGTTLN